jgi:hypothetical protein
LGLALRLLFRAALRGGFFLRAGILISLHYLSEAEWMDAVPHE